jgi:hypothetical protein
MQDENKFSLKSNMQVLHYANSDKPVGSILEHTVKIMRTKIATPKEYLKVQMFGPVLLILGAKPKVVA